jgi:hypothetical protein
MFCKVQNRKDRRIPQMNTHDLPEQVGELRWLVYELGNEMKAISTRPYPHVHRFLMLTLVKKIAKVAERVSEHLDQPVPAPVVRHKVQPIEQSAQHI